MKNIVKEIIAHGICIIVELIGLACIAGLAILGFKLYLVDHELSWVGLFLLLCAVYSTLVRIQLFRYQKKVIEKDIKMNHDVADLLREADREFIRLKDKLKKAEDAAEELRKNAKEIERLSK